MLRSLRSLPLVLAAASLLAPAAAHAVTFPKVKSVAPLKLSVGDRLTIKGTGFRAGPGKSTVVFQRTGKPAIFAKAESATATVITVRLPEKLGAFLVTKAGLPVATRFKLRVLTTRFSRAWTPTKLSPSVSAKAGPAAAAPGAPGASATSGAPAGSDVPLTSYQLCQKDAPLSPTVDADNDGLSNAQELYTTHTDACTADTDGDGIVDGYEYSSALDLNGSALPYPGKRPWPNALDPTDANLDFDGDGLLQSQEYALWKASGAHFPLTVYSDGKQSTPGSQPVTTPAQRNLDLDGNSYLTDDEMDMDADGLSNMVEFNYTGTQKWWNSIKWFQPHPKTPPPADAEPSYTEAPYSIRAFSETDPIVTDTDGDGIPDGADDQDNDGWSNFQEMQIGRGRFPAGSLWTNAYRVHPFNPCLPNPLAITCSRWIPMDGKPWPPFDKTQAVGDALPFGWAWTMDPAIPWSSSMSADPAQTFTGPWNGSHGLQG